MHVSQTIQLPTSIAFPCTPFGKEENSKIDSLEILEKWITIFIYTSNIKLSLWNTESNEFYCSVLILLFF